MRSCFSRVNGTSLNIDTQQRFHADCNRNYNSALGAFVRYRPEVDILPGKTWKCSMRSAFYWFAEFCHSQRLSHFAASFIVTRAEGSIAKSCKNRNSYKQKKFRYDLNRLSSDDHRFPRGESVATFESIHLQLSGLHALTVRFRV